MSDYPHKKRFIALYRAMQTAHPTAKAQYDSLGELKEAFDQFVVDAGDMFLVLKDELDTAVADLGEDFSDPDPRNWDTQDWDIFDTLIEGHKYEAIIRAYANGKPNMHLIWMEIENRL